MELFSEKICYDSYMGNFSRIVSGALFLFSTMLLFQSETLAESSRKILRRDTNAGPTLRNDLSVQQEVAIRNGTITTSKAGALPTTDPLSSSAKSAAGLLPATSTSGTLATSGTLGSSPAYRIPGYTPSASNQVAAPATAPASGAPGSGAGGGGGGGGGNSGSQKPTPKPSPTPTPTPTPVAATPTPAPRAQEESVPQGLQQLYSLVRENESKLRDLQSSPCASQASLASQLKSLQLPTTPVTHVTPVFIKKETGGPQTEFVSYKIFFASGGLMKYMVAEVSKSGAISFRKKLGEDAKFEFQQSSNSKFSDGEFEKAHPAREGMNSVCRLKKALESFDFEDERLRPSGMRGGRS